MIYFIQAGNDGPIKIGLAKQPRLRVKGLQTAHFQELNIIGIMHGEVDTEVELHNIFKNFHIRGEWFRPTPEILDFVNKNCARKVNIVERIENGRYRIYFPEPLIANIDVPLIIGAYKIKILTDKEINIVIGLEGLAKELEQFMLDNGINEQALQQFKSVMSDE